MTSTRGRALLISNEFKVPGDNDQTNWRKGAEVDHQNMKKMLDQLGFVTVGDHKTYSAKVNNL